MIQPKGKKDERAELVKLFRTVLPGDFVKVLENGIHSIIEAELRSDWERSLLCRCIDPQDEQVVYGFGLRKHRKGFLQSLQARGLERSELWISDEHDGLIKSIEAAR